jgi:hypothetical protein
VKAPTTSTPFAKRSFYAGLAVLLALVATYTTAALADWAATPLGLAPQGEARAWLAVAESLHDDTATREPFFRAPAYPTLLAALRDAGIAKEDLADAARVVNGLAHVAATALVALLARRLWRKPGAALLAGALWGFYPPAIFAAAEPGPATLALLVWLGGAAAALGGLWMAPDWQGGRRTRRHFWAYPLVAGVAFALAGALYAPWWPAALAWPLVALLLGHDARGARLVSAGLGVAAVVLGVAVLQDLWGGSPQPLAGADLYRLTLASEVTQPWAAPLPMVEIEGQVAGPDLLEDEAQYVYQYETGQPAQGRAVLAGYWWRRAGIAATTWPLKTGLRTARKVYQFFHYANYGTGPDFARARAESAWLRFNPLGWPAVLALGGVGLALGWRRAAAQLAVGLAALASIGAILWYPTFDARAPVAAMLALLAGGCVAESWPSGVKARLGLGAVALGLLALTWLPRPRDPGALLTAWDARQRAQAWAALGHYDEALAELTRADAAGGASAAGQELAESWRFAGLLAKLPVLPPKDELESEILSNAEIALQSPAAQFRSGVCLWLLGKHEGALFYWRGLAGQDGDWAAEARAAIAASGEETPEEAQQRQAWSLGGEPPMKPELAPLFIYMRASGK